MICRECQKWRSVYHHVYTYMSSCVVGTITECKMIQACSLREDSIAFCSPLLHSQCVPTSYPTPVRRRTCYHHCTRQWVPGVPFGAPDLRSQQVGRSQRAEGALLMTYATRTYSPFGAVWNMDPSTILIVSVNSFMKFNKIESTLGRDN